MVTEANWLLVADSLSLQDQIMHLDTNETISNTFLTAKPNLQGKTTIVFTCKPG